MIVEVTRIDADLIRTKCIEQDWYTQGDIADYRHMLNLAEHPYSTMLLTHIAEDIYEHSNPDIWEDYDGNPVLYIMFELRKDACNTFFEEV